MELIAIFLIMLIFFYAVDWVTDPSDCAICQAPLKLERYIVKHDGKTLHICPQCNAQYEAKLSEYDSDNLLQKNRPPKIAVSGLTGLPVTKFLKKIEQPRGGFINKKSMLKQQIEDGHVLHESENVHPSLIGMAVDYLTRYMLFGDKETSFGISLTGAALVNEKDKAQKLLESIDLLDSKSVIAGLKLSGYDVAYRAGRAMYRNIDSIEPDRETVENVITMVKRSVLFFKKEKVIDSGMTFEGAYTKNVSAGDADYLTEDTIWDMKVTKAEPGRDHTIQLVIYYLLMKESIKYRSVDVKRIGIFNPRKNISYTYELKNMDPDVLEYIYGLIND